MLIFSLFSTHPVKFFVYGLLIAVPVARDLCDRVTINNELRRIWKELIVA
jgi:hypothetical protein